MADESTTPVAEITPDAAPEGEAPEGAVPEEPSDEGPIDGSVWVDQTEGEGDEEASTEGEDAQEGTEGSVEADEAEATTVAPEGEGQAPESGEDAEEATEAEPPPPLVFRSHGREVAPPGAFVHRVEPTEEGGKAEEFMVIPSEAWASHILPRIATKEALDTQRKEYEGKLREMAPDANEEVIRANAVVKELEAVLSDENALRSFLQNFQLESAALRTRVDNAVLTAKGQFRETLDQERTREYRVAQAATQIAEDLPAQLDQMRTALGDHVDDTVFERIRERVFQDVERYYVVPDTDEQAREFGIAPGTVGRRLDLLQQDVLSLLRLAYPNGKPNVGQSDTKRDVAARKNRAASGNKRPPDAVTPKTPAAPQAQPTPQKMDRETWQRWKRGG